MDHPFRTPLVDHDSVVWSAFSRRRDVGNTINTDVAGDELITGYTNMSEFGTYPVLALSIIGARRRLYCHRFLAWATPIEQGAST